MERNANLTELTTVSSYIKIVAAPGMVQRKSLLFNKSDYVLAGPIKQPSGHLNLSRSQNSFADIHPTGKKYRRISFLIFNISPPLRFVFAVRRLI